MVWTAKPQQRVSPGGRHEAGGPPRGNEAEAEAHLLIAHMEHLEANLQRLQRQMEAQRERRGRFYTEIMIASADVRAEPQQSTQDQFRVCYIYAYVGGGTTHTAHLYLKGQLSGVHLRMPVPANTQPPLQVCLGDAETGGIILERRDLRYITTDDATAQELCVILAGEILSDTYLAE
jgi:hypothetical protein